MSTLRDWHLRESGLLGLERDLDMRTATIIAVLLVFASGSLALAAGARKGYLTRPNEGPDPDARGFVKAKGSPGADRLMVKIAKVDRGDTFDLYIQTDEGSDSFEWFGEIEIAGRPSDGSRGGGAGKWMANTRRGDSLPLDADSVADLAGLTVEVRDGDGRTVLTGAVPDVEASKKKRKAKSDLDIPDVSEPVEEKADGFVQAGAEFLKVAVQGVSASTYDVLMDDGGGGMEVVGDLHVGKDGGDGLWMVNTKRGDPLPFDADSIRDLVGRIVEVRNPDGDVVLQGVVPDFEEGGKTEKPGKPGPGGPSLRILATDAPFPFENVRSAIVTVERIEIREVGASFETLIEWESGRDLDLVELRNGVVNILYAGDPDPGDYDAIRIIVHAKEITIEDAGVIKVFDDFKIPSGEQTGIKVFIKPVVEVVTDLTQDVILDFDLAKSFIVQGNPKTPAGIKGFHFKPVIRAVNKTVAGTLTFRVMSDNGTPGDRSDDFHLNGSAYKVIDTTATPPDDVVASGSSGTDPDDATVNGYVFHPGIVAGSYKLEVAYRDHDTLEQRLAIHAGNLSDEGTIVLAATAAYIKGTVTTEIKTKDGQTLTFAVEGASVEGTIKGDGSPSASDTTSSLGAYALTSLTFSTYEVKVTKIGYKDATGESGYWVPGDPAATDLDFTLEPETADVTGTVTDGNAAAVEGATVMAVIRYAGTDEVIAETTTDVDGKYTLTALPTASYTIQAEHEDAGTRKTGSETLDHTGGGSSATVDLTIE